MQIVQTDRFLKDLKRLGASAKQIAALESSILANPEIGDVVPGLGGLRKMRFGLGNKGKRGGGRAIYFLRVSEALAIMVFAYSKAEKTDMTQEEKRIALQLVREFENDRER